MAHSKAHSMTSATPSSPRTVPAKSLSALDIVLTMSTGSDHRRITLMAGQKTEIGRASRSENRHAVAAPNNGLFDCPVISRNHAELLYQPFQEPSKVVNIKDLSSKHGTTVNGVKLLPNRNYDLHSGDRIKFGGPITVGAGKVTLESSPIRLNLEADEDPESHDGVTMTFQPCFPPPLPEEKDSLFVSPQRGFRAPSYDSDNYAEGLERDFASDMDEEEDDDDEYDDDDDNNDDGNDNEDVGDDDGDDDEEDDDVEVDEDDDEDDANNGNHAGQIVPEQIKMPYVIDLEQSKLPVYIDLDPSTETTGNAASKTLSKGMANDDTPSRSNVNVPDPIPRAATPTFPPGGPSTKSTSRAARPPVWPDFSMGDIVGQYQSWKSKPVNPAYITEISDHESDEGTWFDNFGRAHRDKAEPFRPASVSHGASMGELPSKVTKDGSTASYISPDAFLDTDKYDFSDSKFTDSKARYDPVRSSPCPVESQTTSFVVPPMVRPLAYESGLSIPPPHAAYQAHLAKIHPVTEQASTNPFESEFRDKAFSHTVPEDVAPKSRETNDVFALPAVGDLMQSLAWMDKPAQPTHSVQPAPSSHPANLSKMSIPELVEDPVNSVVEAPQVHVEPAFPTSPSTVEKRNKRKADTMENSEAKEIPQGNPVKKARIGIQHPASKRSDMVKGVFIGAIGGAIGTMALLASPATEMLLDWLEA